MNANARGVNHHIADDWLISRPKNYVFHQRENIIVNNFFKCEIINTYIHTFISKKI